MTRGQLEGFGVLIDRLLQVNSIGPSGQSFSSAFSSDMNSFQPSSPVQSSPHDGPCTLEVVVEPPRVVQPGDTFPCPIVVGFQQPNHGCKSLTRLGNGGIFLAHVINSRNCPTKLRGSRGQPDLGGRVSRVRRRCRHPQYRWTTHGGWSYFAIDWIIDRYAPCTIC